MSKRRSQNIEPFQLTINHIVARFRGNMILDVVKDIQPVKYRSIPVSGVHNHIIFFAECVFQAFPVDLHVRRLYSGIRALHPHHSATRLLNCNFLVEGRAICIMDMPFCTERHS